MALAGEVYKTPALRAFLVGVFCSCRRCGPADAEFYAFSG